MNIFPIQETLLETSTSKRASITDFYQLNAIERFRYVCLTPQTGKQAERLVYVGLTNPDPEKYDIVLQLRRFLDVMDIKLRLEELSTSHFVVLDNRNGVTGHLLRVKPTIIRELLQLVQVT